MEEKGRENTCDEKKTIWGSWGPVGAMSYFWFRLRL